jgi:hypothetical protein
VLPAEQRGRGEADGWAATIVAGGGAADERGPSGSGRGREEQGADRQDRPVSGVDGGEAAACAGRAWAGPGRKRVGRAQMNNRILDLLKSVLNKFKLI